MLLALCNGTHVVGGSDIGCRFLRDSGSHIPDSFLGYAFPNSGMSVEFCIDYCILECIPHSVNY